MIVRDITAFVIVEMAFDGINVDRYKIGKEQVKKANYKEDCFAQKKRKSKLSYTRIYTDSIK